MAEPSEVYTISYDDDYDVAYVKSLVSKAWQSSQSLPCLKLEASKTASPREKVFTKASVRDITSKGYADMTNNRGDLHKDLNKLLGTKIMLIPCLVPVSKLFLFIHQGQQVPILHNSLYYIRDLNILVQEIYKLSKLPRLKKKDILSNMNTVLDQMVTFGANSISKLYVHEYSDELPQLFARENYYLNFNLIRAFEFTIMDLLGIKEVHQIGMSTPLEWTQDAWEDSSSYELGIYAGLNKSLLESLNTAFQQKIPYSEDYDNQVWPPKKIYGFGFIVNKKLMSTYLFWCGNHDVCSKRETALNQFQLCPGCKWVKFCSAACQKAHSEKHGKFCRQKMNDEIKKELFESRRLIISITGERDEK